MVESALSAVCLGLISVSGRSPGEGNSNPLQYSCLKKSHGYSGLTGYSPWGHRESEKTEQPNFHFQPFYGSTSHPYMTTGKTAALQYGPLSAK